MRHAAKVRNPPYTSMVNQQVNSSGGQFMAAVVLLEQSGAAPLY